MLKCQIICLRRLFAYLWALPATMLGLAFVPLACMSGGKIQLVDGVIEISGGLVAHFLQKGMFVIDSATAMTLGHVILGQNEICLEQNRRHERVHVSQYERWGLLMIPVYLLASGAARLRGAHPYWDNRFEREAFAHEASTQEACRETSRLPPTFPQTQGNLKNSPEVIR